MACSTIINRDMYVAVNGFWQTFVPYIDDTNETKNRDLFKSLEKEYQYYEKNAFMPYY